MQYGCLSPEKKRSGGCRSRVASIVPRGHQVTLMACKRWPKTFLISFYNYVYTKQYGTSVQSWSTAFKCALRSHNDDKVKEHHRTKHLGLDECFSLPGGFFYFILIFISKKSVKD